MHKKEVKFCKNMKRSYNLVLILIIAVLAVTLLIVSIMPKQMDTEGVVLYVKPVNCGALCNDGEIRDIIKLTGRTMVAYEAEFVKSPLVLIAKENKLNLVAAQSAESLKKDLCTIVGGKVCE